jgi:hypothetical protein
METIGFKADPQNVQAIQIELLLDIYGLCQFLVVDRIKQISDKDNVPSKQVTETIDECILKAKQSKLISLIARYGELDVKLPPLNKSEE